MTTEGRWWTLARVTAFLLIVQVALTIVVLGLGIRQLSRSADQAREQSELNSIVLQRIEDAMADNQLLFDEHAAQVRCVLLIPSGERLEGDLDRCFDIHEALPR